MKAIIRSCLSLLAQRRPLFHSEADFQFEFAWQLREYGILTRLEVPIKGVGEVDLIIPIQKGNDREYFIEFKYKTKELHSVVEDESFHLKGHSANPLGRYDFIKDIERIESSGKSGFAIFLTNDPLYWKKGVQGNGAAFDLMEGREVSGRMAWINNAKTSSIGAARTSPLEIKGRYLCKWDQYSVKGGDIFRALIIEVV